MNICIYTVHLFLYEWITCKVKSCLFNYCTFHISYITTNTQKYKITSMKKTFLVDILSLLLVRPKIFLNITSDVFRCHAPGKNLLECGTHPLLWCPHMQHSWHPTETSDLVVYDHILSSSILKKWKWLCCGRSTYICSQTWLVTVNGWFKLYCD